MRARTKDCNNKDHEEDPGTGHDEDHGNDRDEDHNDDHDKDHNSNNKLGAAYNGTAGRGAPYNEIAR